MDNNKNTPKQCSICKGELEFLAEVPVRAYGAKGMTQLFFGQWAEVGEEKLPIDLFRCKKCGHLELFDLDFSLKMDK